MNIGDRLKNCSSYVATLLKFKAAVSKAEGHWRRGEYALALDEYSRILLQRLRDVNERKSSFLDDDLFVSERVADLAVMFGRVEGADKLLAGISGLCERMGYHSRADYATLKRIHLAVGSAQFDTARSLFNQMGSSIGPIGEIEYSANGLVRWERNCHWSDTDADDRAGLFSRMHLALGSLMMARGYYDKAAAVFERGLFHAGKDKPDLAQQAAPYLRLSLSQALLEKGELSLAGAQLNTLHPRLNDLDQPALTTCWHELSGKLCLLRGNFGEALEHFWKVLDLCKRYGVTRAVMCATLNLAHVSIVLNQTYEAEKLLRTAQTLADDLNDTNSAIRVAFLFRLCRAHSRSMARGVSIAPTVTEMWRLGETIEPAAKENLEEEFPQFSPTDSFLASFEHRALEFGWALNRCDFTDAAKILSAIKKDFAETDSELIQSRVAVLEAMLAYYEKDFLLAEGLLNTASQKLRTLGLQSDLWQALRYINWCKAALNRPMAEQSAIAEERKEILDAMLASLNGEDRAIFLLPVWTAEEEDLAGQIDKLSYEKSRLMVKPVKPWYLRLLGHWRLRKRVHDLLVQIDNYKTRLVQRTVADDENPASRSVACSLWQRLWRHPRNRTTLVYLVLPDRVFVAHVGWLSLNFGVSSMVRIELRNLVRQWHEMVKEDAGGLRAIGASPNSTRLEQTDNSDKINSILTRLAEELQFPQILSSLPKRVRALTIVPDDSLHGFPFAAIVHNDRRLIQHFALSIAYFSYHHIAEKPVGQRRALVVGISQPLGNFEGLPGVAEELQHVEHRLKSWGFDSQVLLDDAAEKETVLKHLPDASWLHIACHGVFEPSRPDCSGLVLKSALGQPETLSLRELSDFELGHVQHVTLSSCWSADSFILPGRWIISLPETLLRAGVQSILSCLWTVDDKIAVAFMARFYEYLDSHSREEALRQTVIDCLKCRLPGYENVDTSDPLFWAGYNLYGNGRVRSKQ